MRSIADEKINKTKTNPRYDQAAELLSYGLALIPVYEPIKGGCSCGDPQCAKPGKHPRIKDWTNNWTKDFSQVEKWLKKWPKTNLGIATGQASMVVVLDVDGEEGEENLKQLEAAHAALPHTWEVITGGGGRHIYFKCTAELNDIKNAVRFRPGLDLRTNGGQVLAHGSLHSSGAFYEWEILHHPDEVELADMPEWLLEIIQDNQDHEDKPLLSGERFDVTKVLAGVPEGSRDTELFKYASSLRARGMKKEEAEILVLQAAAACTPPFPRKEALIKIESAWRYPEGSEKTQALEAARERIEGITSDNVYEPESLGALALLKAQAPAEYAKAKQSLKGQINLPDLERAIKHELASNRNLKVISRGEPRQDKKTLPRTPEGLSKRFLTLHGHEVLWVEAWKCWMIYDGQRWKKDDTVKIIGLAKNVARMLLQEAYKADDSDERKAIREFSEKAESINTIKEFLALSKPEVAVTTDHFDKNPWLFNCMNGTVDLRTGTLRPHSSADYITCLSPTNADPTADAPLWRRFLIDIFQGDPQLIEYVKRGFGMCLSGITRDQIFFLLWGTGANGKSTLLNTILNVIGRDYGAQASMTAFLARKYDSGTSEELAALAGARLVVATETQRGRQLNETAIKAITGGDRLRVRRLYENSWEFTPQFKVVLCSNYKPNATGTDEALWRRARLVPFTVKFEGERRDNNLPFNLMTESTGILRWLIEGCMEWQKEGLQTPEAVNSATADWKNENDLTALFLAACCQIGSQFKCRVRDLYAAYENWAADTQEACLSQRRFNQEVRDHGFSTFAGTGNVTWWNGIGLPGDFDSS